MSSRSRDDLRLLMQASIDGELDAAGALELERCLAEDRSLAVEYERLVTLRDAIADRFRGERAPDTLRATVTALAETKSAAPPAARPRYEWRAIAASALVAASLASGVTWFAATSRNQSTALDRTLVADHMRSLLAASPVDVVSSDRHTVKPWFDEHLAQSPAVVDLSNRGFVLVGGRVDIVDGRPAPTLVYKIREHLISLTALRGSTGKPPATPGSISGYSILAWREGDFAYWAVSDVERSDLEAFVAAFRAAAAG